VTEYLPQHTPDAAGSVAGQVIDGQLDQGKRLTDPTLRRITVREKSSG
jgi:hypothetical protein